MSAAAWAWAALAVLVTVFVAVFDVWATRTGHATMSAQFHAWMTGQWSGPVAVFLWTGATGGLLYHFLINK